LVRLGVGVEVRVLLYSHTLRVRITQGQITRVLSVLTTHHDAQPSITLMRHPACVSASEAPSMSSTEH